MEFLQYCPHNEPLDVDEIFVNDLSSFPQLLCESGLPPKDIVEIAKIMLPYCGNVVLCSCWELMLSREEISEIRGEFPAIGRPQTLKVLCRLAIRQQMPTQAFDDLAERFEQILPLKVCHYLAYHSRKSKTEAK